MKIQNYDVKDDVITNIKQLYPFMSNQCFKKLICFPSGSGL